MQAQFDIAILRGLLSGESADAACPVCGPECRSAANRARKVLRVWDHGGVIGYKCARCEVSGWVRDDTGLARPAKVKTKTKTPDRALVARQLWERSKSLRGSLAEVYLRSRSCFINSPALRFLPGTERFPPAMVARFGEDIVTGIHLTRLRDDGSGKAPGDKAKIMIGPSVGQPIIVFHDPRNENLFIAEGIEDAATLAQCRVTWNAWAAGAAMRMATVLPAAARFKRIAVAVDNDYAGRKALEAAQKVRPDVIQLHFGDGLDANKVLLTVGRKALSKLLTV